MLTDTHCHLSSEELMHLAPTLVEKAYAQGICKIVNVATDEASFLEGLLLSRSYQFVHLSAATPPQDVTDSKDVFFDRVKTAALEGRLIAIGETGLDYLYAASSRKSQQDCLINYFELALQSSLPVVIHCREAFSDLFKLADSYYRSDRLVIHCFTGNEIEAKEAVKRGWMISLSGILTFKKSDTLRAIVRDIPMENIVLETDAPYLAPQSKRGQLNEPLFLKETAECLANIKNLKVEEVAYQTTLNASRLFCF